MDEARRKQLLTLPAWQSTDNCKNIMAYLSGYSVAECALIWCGVPLDDLPLALEDAKQATTTGKAKFIWRSKTVPCLEPRTQLIGEAIRNDELKITRDGFRPSKKYSEDVVACERIKILAVDFKEWLIEHHPNDKPPALFDELERKTHTAITTESYAALERQISPLKAENAALTARIDRAVEVYKINQEKIKCLEEENKKLLEENRQLKMLSGAGTITTEKLLTLIGIIRDMTKRKQADFINTITGYCERELIKGFSERTLKDIFSAVNKMSADTP